VLGRLLRVVGLVWLACAGLCALDPKTLQPQGYINDFAGVVPAEQRASINRYAAAVERATGVQIAIVTVKSLEGAPIEDFANDLFRQWGIGQKATNEGLLFLFAIDDHRSRLEVGRGLEPIITDGTSGSVLREMRPALRAGNYGGAFETAARELGQRIAQAKGVSIDEDGGSRRREAPGGGSEFPFPIVLFLVFLVAMFLISRNRSSGGGGGGGFLPGLVIGNMMGGRSPWGGTVSGGFGGYDSGGGGFGGFGGGDSGGGGASSDW
jgi:uncharacterized protein